MPRCASQLALDPVQCPMPLQIRVAGSWSEMGATSDGTGGKHSRGGSHSVASQWVTTHLRCRAAHETFIFTFLDHDGSVQHAAATAPLSPEPRAAPDTMSAPVFLTLHGTGVSAQSQADAYKVSAFPFVFRSRFNVSSHLVLWCCAWGDLGGCSRRKPIRVRPITRLGLQTCGFWLLHAMALTTGKAPARCPRCPRLMHLYGRNPVLLRTSCVASMPCFC